MPLRTEGGIVRGLDAGHSLGFYERLWLHSWFVGAAMVTPENSLAIFFERPGAPWVLTEHGRKAAEVYRFMTRHDRGVPYTPVAVVLDRYAGCNGYRDKPWGILDPTPGDRELRDLFDHRLFPGSDPIHARPAGMTNERWHALTRALLPVTIADDPIQYAVNRTPHGRVIGLINNRGVLKRGDQPMVVDPPAAQYSVILILLHNRS